MAGHIDVRVKVAAPLGVLWDVVSATDGPGKSTGPGGPGAHGHETAEWNPARESMTYRINPGPDRSARTWAYRAERIVDRAAKTAYARRWGNDNFVYSYAFWQYTGSETESQLRCVADFEMAAGSPMDDRQMEEFMGRGTRAAMEKTARAAEKEYGRRAGVPGGE